MGCSFFGHWILWFLLRHDHLTLIKVVENLALIFNTLGQVLWIFVEGPKLYGWEDVCDALSLEVWICP
jgi:hypothetical protein